MRLYRTGFASLYTALVLSTSAAGQTCKDLTPSPPCHGSFVFDMTAHKRIGGTSNFLGDELTVETGYLWPRHSKMKVGLSVWFGAGEHDRRYGLKAQGRHSSDQVRTEVAIGVFHADVNSPWRRVTAGPPADFVGKGSGTGLNAEVWVGLGPVDVGTGLEAARTSTVTDVADVSPRGVWSPRIPVSNHLAGYAAARLRGWPAFAAMSAVFLGRFLGGKPIVQCC